MSFIAVIWVGLAFLAGAAARSKGRSGLGWFLLALVISPLFALILLMAFGSRVKGPAKTCPFCHSEVSAYATVCPHCQREIEGEPEVQARKAALIRRGNAAAYVALGFAAVVVIGAIAMLIAGPPYHPPK